MLNVRPDVGWVPFPFLTPHSIRNRGKIVMVSDISVRTRLSATIPATSVREWWLFLRKQNRYISFLKIRLPENRWKLMDHNALPSSRVTDTKNYACESKLLTHIFLQLMTEVVNGLGAQFGAWERFESEEAGVVSYFHTAFYKWVWVIGVPVLHERLSWFMISTTHDFNDVPDAAISKTTFWTQPHKQRKDVGSSSFAELLW